MIKSVKITNKSGESITLELQRPEKSGFVVKSIDGLSPTKATINTVELAGVDGGIYNSSRLGSRNITLELLFLENPTIEDTRQLSYKYFNIKQYIELQIETDIRVYRAVGYIESNEADIFSKEEGCSVSILCPDSYLYGINKSKIDIASIAKKFEFPFSNESITDKLINLGEIGGSTFINAYYDGDIDNGLKFVFHITTDVLKDFSIYSYKTGKTFKLNDNVINDMVGSTIVKNDYIIIDTTINNKSVQLYRNAEYINILNAVERPYVWFNLTKGDNLFIVSTNSEVAGYTGYVEYDSLYEGV